MNRKNVIRTLTVVAVVLLLGWSFYYFSDDTRGFKPVDTSVAMSQISSDNVKSAQIDDREQQLRLELKKSNSDTQDSDKIITKYPTGYAVTLFDEIGADTDVVLLGSVASPKYTQILVDIFGSRLLFPIDFVGRGDMSRGGLLLRMAAAGTELEYAAVSGSVLRGRRPPKLPPLRRTR